MRCAQSSSSSLRRLASVVLIALAAVSVGACGNSRHGQNQPPAWAGAVPEPNQQVAASSPRYEPEPGDPIKEAPALPLRSRQAEPDDPSEPFSPNYGGPNAPARVAVRSHQHRPRHIVTAGAE